MDKDVEVSKDQNTVVINGTRYMAQPAKYDPATMLVCTNCDLNVVDGTSKEYCSFIPCCHEERHDHSEVIFKVKL